MADLQDDYHIARAGTAYAKRLTGHARYHLQVIGPAHGVALSVVSFECVERMGEPYRLTIELTHPDELPCTEYLGRDAMLSDLRYIRMLMEQECICSDFQQGKHGDVVSGEVMTTACIGITIADGSGAYAKITNGKSNWQAQAERLTSRAISMPMTWSVGASPFRSGQTYW